MYAWIQVCKYLWMNGMHACMRRKWIVQCIKILCVYYNLCMYEFLSCCMSATLQPTDNSLNVRLYFVTFCSIVVELRAESSKWLASKCSTHCLGIRQECVWWCLYSTLKLWSRLMQNGFLMIWCITVVLWWQICIWLGIMQLNGYILSLHNRGRHSHV